MTDLAIGFIIIAVTAIGLFFLAEHGARRLSQRLRTFAVAMVVGVLFFYVRTLWYDVRVAAIMPFSNLVVLSNWLPFFAAVIGGVAGQTQSLPLLWRGTLVGMLGAVGVLAAFYPILGAVPKCGDRWDKLGTCLQTTHATCSPAAAATLLRKHGIQATEQEMAELCLTRAGTSWQGLYRGLKLKTAGTNWDVQVCAISADDLLQPRTAPMIVSVGLDRGAPGNTDFTREFGWVPGVNHSVVIERFSSNRSAVIADPACEMCREQWNADTLRTLWRGYGMRLVRRPN